MSEFCKVGKLHERCLDVGSYHLPAFRMKIRTDALEARAVTESSAYAEKVKLGHEIAEVLRKNVVQAHKESTQSTTDGDVWSAFHFLIFYEAILMSRLFLGIQLRDGIEIGDNESIKAPLPSQINSRRARKQDKGFKWALL